MLGLLHVHRAEAEELKAEGNAAYKAADYTGAVDYFTRAIGTGLHAHMQSCRACSPSIARPSPTPADVVHRRSPPSHALQRSRRPTPRT